LSGALYNQLWENAVSISREYTRKGEADKSSFLFGLNSQAYILNHLHQLVSLIPVGQMLLVVGCGFDGGQSKGLANTCLTKRLFCAAEGGCGPK
jgi:hypothetical protein